ncbi:Heparinase II/III-like protein [Cetobacterium ceti]|uniref:Heparinase II/III-like protein n=1 Tax=Cetobacterium ceti TaxID=180163 RepID=A0A1T4MTI1_9FUSO|nr:alginate lyase family protein [Cetobacterium ceti]SJZ70137.1 Heparinase II/III-like protein [Cetobacterium ceti]
MKGFLNNKENFQIALLMIDQFPEEYKIVIDTANMIVEQNFIFNHKWDMEVCKTPYKFNKNIIWNYVPFQDPEWTFMLNRHKFWLDLGKAYSLTKDEKYAKAFFNQISHWIDSVDLKNPTFEHCTRTIEMGIRAINWIKALELFKESSFFNKNIEKKISDSLYNQCQILMDIYDDFRTLSNWGILQNTGILVFSIVFNNYSQSKEMFNTALKRLIFQCQIQILPDGIHWEQSPMYQNEVLNCLLDVAIILRNNNLDIPREILDGIKKLAYSNLIMAKPNHHQPMQGDSDDTDLRDIITRAAYILEDGYLKFGAYKNIDFESIWELGLNSIETYNKIKAIQPDFTSAQLKESGNFYLRDSFLENSNYLWFRCGPIGSGHGHGEHLHFDLSIYGENFISDPGRCTYVEEDIRREYLRGVTAHNTTIIDKKSFSEFKGAWGIVNSAYTLNTHFISETYFDYVEGGHLGYVYLNNPVVTFRKILYLKPNIWIVIDEFHTNGEHTYNQIFNFDPEKKVNLKKNSAEIIGTTNNLKIHWLENIDLKKVEGIFSREYNKLEKNIKIISEISEKDNKMIFTAFIGQKNKEKNNIKIKEVPIVRGDKTFVPKTEARAIEIIISETEKYIFVNSTKDIAHQKKSYLVENTLFYGKVALIKKEKKNTEIKILKY